MADKPLVRAVAVRSFKGIAGEGILSRGQHFNTDAKTLEQYVARGIAREVDVEATKKRKATAKKKTAAKKSGPASRKADKPSENK